MEQPKQGPVTGLEDRPSRSASPAMVQRIRALGEASESQSRLASLIHLVRWIQRMDRRSANHAGLASVVEHLEIDEQARKRLQAALALLLKEEQSISLLAETGIPSDHSLFAEFVRRLVAKFLPPVRQGSDVSRLLIRLYSSQRQMHEFTEIPPDLFTRMVAILPPADSSPVWSKQQSDLREALRLLALVSVGWG
jgi:site-specific recombinase